MHSQIHNLLALLLLSTSSLTSSSPVPATRRAGSSCPATFGLTVLSRNHSFTNLSIIQSGRSTYLSARAPTYPDSAIHFFQNDTTHLYATGFNTSYMGATQKPPYKMITLQESGFNIFAADPAATEKYQHYVEGNYIIVNRTIHGHGDENEKREESKTTTTTTTTTTKAGCNSTTISHQELDFRSSDGGVGGWWVCGAEDAGVWGVQVGTSGFGNGTGSGCQRVRMGIVRLSPSAADVC